MATTVPDRSLRGSDTSVYLSPQTTKGAVDANPVFDQFRRTEGSPGQEVTYTNSNEVKVNRQARQQIKDAVTFSGELSFELTQDTAKYLDGLVHGTQADNSITAVITIGSTATGFVSSASDFANLSVGDWFKASGFTDSTIDGYYKVKTKADDNNIDTEVAPLAVEAAGASVTFESRKTSSGADQTYYTSQSRTADKSVAGDVDYRTFYDAVINTGSLDIGETGIVTGAFGLNIESLLPGTASVSGQSDNAVDTSDVISAIDNVTAIYVDGVDSDCGVKSFGFEFNNNYSGDRSAGCTGERYAYGNIEVSGSLNTRAIISNTFEWRDRYENSTPFSLAIAIDWEDGKWMVIEILRAKITEHSMPDGANVVAVNEMSYNAEEDPNTSSTLNVFRNF